MMRVLLTALVVLVLLLAVIGCIGYFAEDRIAQAPTPDAAPAPAQPTPVQACAEDYCMNLDCDQLWEIWIDGWKTCRGHDRRAPFNQELTAESVIDAARRITKEAVQ